VPTTVTIVADAEGLGFGAPFLLDIEAAFWGDSVRLLRRRLDLFIPEWDWVGVNQPNWILRRGLNLFR
jgi:hypothetical protein